MDDLERMTANVHRLPGRYDAFISYSHAVDGALAPSLHGEIERFAKPWFRSRARRLFHDNANLSAAPELWAAIEAALASSAWFVLLASPESAASHWVDKEVQWWLSNRNADHILIVLTGGELAWQPDTGGIDLASTTALPPALMAAKLAEPRWVDMRWAHDLDHLDPANPTFRNCVADITAAITSTPKDELVGEHVRRHRQTMRWVRTVVIALSVLLIATTFSAALAVLQRNTARAQTLQATSRQLVAEATSIEDTQPGLARQLLAEAYRLAPTNQAVGAIMASASMPQVIPSRGLARGITFSPGGNVVAVASDQGVSLYQATTTALISTLEGQRGYIDAVAFDDGGDLLAAAGADGTVRLWDVTSTKHPVLLSALQVTDSILERVAFIPHAPYLLVVTANAAIGVVSIQDKHQPAIVASVPGFATAGIMNALAVSDDGHLAATSGENGKVNLWDLSTRNVLRPLGQLKGSANVIAFSATSSLVAVGGSDDTTRLWDVADPTSPALRATLTGQSLGIDSVAVTNDGDTLATGAGNGTIQLWDISDPFRPAAGSRLTGQTTGIAGLAFSPDGHTLASASADGAAVASDGSSRSNSTVRVWSVIGSSRSAALTVISSRDSSPPMFSPDGRTMAAGIPTTLWDLSDRARPRSVSMLPTVLVGGHGVTFSPDGHLLATGDPVQVWDVTNRRDPRNLTPHTIVTSGVDFAMFGPGTSILATGQLGQPIKLWDLQAPARPTLVSTLAGSWGASQAAAFSTDGKAVATLTSDGAVQIWDITHVASPKLVSHLKPASGNVKVAIFIRDGRTLLTGSTLGVIAAWDVHDPAHPRLRGSAAGHTGVVGGLAYDPSGLIAASASEDGTIRLWDLRDLSHPTEVSALNSGGIYASAQVSFSPDGRTLAAASSDGVQLFDVNVAGVLQRLCAQSPRITPAQWEQYLTNQPYDPPCV